MPGDESQSGASASEPPTPPPPPPVEPPPEPGIWNYMVRHWRGQQTLAWSYWINVFLISIVYSLVGLMLDYFGGKYGQDHGRLLVIFSVAYLLIIIAIYVWQLVGCWRSAINHIRQTGRRFWAIVTMLVLILGVFKTAKELGQFSEAYLELGKIFLGIDDVSQMRAMVYVSDDGVLVLDGAIDFDTPGQVRKLAGSNPSIDLIELDSIGGRGLPAFELADIVSRNQWTTYVANECSSACAMVFLAGYDRIVHADAYLGFHQEDLLGLSADDIPDVGPTQAEFYRERRIPDWFIERMEATLPDDMWYPNLKQLGDASIVTHIFDGELTLNIDAYCNNASCE